jgi:ubiquinone/menaquinone biosynthesis C-methylase UbiE
MEKRQNRPMETLKRKPFQGVTNVVKFNWHFYLIAFFIAFSLLASTLFLSDNFKIYGYIFAILILLPVIISLLITNYIYDYSKIYNLNFLNHLKIKPTETIVNINAGFDEFSLTISNKFKTEKLHVFDFYNPEKHTEISIERARKVSKIYPNTTTIQTSKIPLEANSVDFVFLFFAAHEIRNSQERIIFFKEINRILNQNGKIIVLEPLVSFIFYQNSIGKKPSNLQIYQSKPKPKSRLFYHFLSFKKMEVHLKFIGILLILLSLLHIGFSKYFQWKTEFQNVSLVNIQMMYVHTFFVAFVVFLMGIFSFFYANEIIYTPLGKTISFGIFIFWFTRLIFQFFVYSSKLWKGKTFETTMHVLFSILWSYLTIIYFLVFWN